MHLPSVSPRSRLSATTEKPPSGCSNRASIMRSPSSQAAENVAAVATYRQQPLSGIIGMMRVEVESKKAVSSQVMGGCRGECQRLCMRATCQLQ